MKDREVLENHKEERSEDGETKCGERSCQCTGEGARTLDEINRSQLGSLSVSCGKKNHTSGPFIPQCEIVPVGWASGACLYLLNEDSKFCWRLSEGLAMRCAECFEKKYLLDSKSVNRGRTLVCGCGCVCRCTCVHRYTSACGGGGLDVSCSDAKRSYILRTSGGWRCENCRTEET